eukprot:GILK01006894.1.p1 GENE.GILK01006894.1~~GILK01006894.1.p1  ORF type:complete len:1053 (-),score=194.29 GILK01006894.1:79-3237(-)
MMAVSSGPQGLWLPYSRRARVGVGVGIEVGWGCLLLLLLLQLASARLCQLPVEGSGLDEFFVSGLTHMSSFVVDKAHPSKGILSCAKLSNDARLDKPDSFLRVLGMGLPGYPTPGLFFFHTAQSMFDDMANDALERRLAYLGPDRVPFAEEAPADLAALFVFRKRMFAIAQRFNCFQRSNVDCDRAFIAEFDPYLSLLTPSLVRANRDVRNSLVLRAWDHLVMDIHRAATVMDIRFVTALDEKELTLLDGLIVRFILTSVQHHSHHDRFDSTEHILTMDERAALKLFFATGSLLDSLLIDVARPLLWTPLQVPAIVRPVEDAHPDTESIPAFHESVQLELHADASFDIIEHSAAGGPRRTPFSIKAIRDFVERIESGQTGPLRMLTKRSKVAAAVSLRWIEFPSRDDFETFGCAVLFNLGRFAGPANAATAVCLPHFVKWTVRQSATKLKETFPTVDPQRHHWEVGSLIDSPTGSSASCGVDATQLLRYPSTDDITLVGTQGAQSPHFATLQKLAIRGFPDCIRGVMYHWLSGSEFSSVPAVREAEYRRLLRTTRLFSAEGVRPEVRFMGVAKEKLAFVSTEFRQIKKDVGRLAQAGLGVMGVEGNGMYKFGLQAVERVSRALEVSDLRCRTKRNSQWPASRTSDKDTRLDYVQTLSHLIGHLLQYMSEVDAYFALRYLVTSRGLDQYLCFSAYYPYWQQAANRMLTLFPTLAGPSSDDTDHMPNLVTSKVMALAMAFGFTIRESLTQGTRTWREIGGGSLLNSMLDRMWFDAVDGTIEYFLAAVDQQQSRLIDDEEQKQINSLFQGLDENAFWKFLDKECPPSSSSHVLLRTVNRFMRPKKCDVFPFFNEVDFYSYAETVSRDEPPLLIRLSELDQKLVPTIVVPSSGPLTAIRAASDTDEDSMVSDLRDEDVTNAVDLLAQIASRLEKYIRSSDIVDTDWQEMANSLATVIGPLKGAEREAYRRVARRLQGIQEAIEAAPLRTPTVAGIRTLANRIREVAGTLTTLHDQAVTVGSVGRSSVDSFSQTPSPSYLGSDPLLSSTPLDGILVK